MKFRIDPQIFEQFPDFKMGVILLKGFDNTRRRSDLHSLVRGVSAQRAKEFANKKPEEHPRIRAWMDTYAKLGVNPKKYPPSVYALLKRVAKGGDLPSISLMVDLYNYFSLKYLLPLGSEDLDCLYGDLELTFTKGGEPFRAIGSIDVEEAKDGEVAYIDKAGITCRYWNYREGERTKITPKTRNAAIIIEDISKLHMDEFGAIINEISAALMKYGNGQITPFILNEEQNELDFGVEGRVSADDSKVTQQEKLHFEKLQNQKSPKTAAAPEQKEPQKQTIKLENEAAPLQLFADDLLIEKAARSLENALQLAFPKILNKEIHLEYPADSSHGDYACNIAMHLAKELGEAPRSIADKIVEQFSSEQFTVSIAGPGFLNLQLQENALSESMDQILEQAEKYGHSSIGKGKNIIIEYSAPNIAKPLGVQHLLSTIIGQSLKNIFASLGFDAIGINHIGDWGTQFGKLIYAYKTWGNKGELSKDPIEEMLKLYVKFHDEVEKNPHLDDAAREEFRKFEEGDKENRRLWQWFVDESLKEIDQTYQKLGGIAFDEIMGESFYEDKMEPLLKDGKERGIFVKGEEGAYISEFDDESMPPMIVQKKDGATIYATRDMATLKYRIETWRPLRILYVVDTAQSLHFKQVFATASRFPWYHNEAVHIVFGRMSMPEGSMSTRKGTMIRLEAVLDEAVERATKIIELKNPDLANKSDVARIVGIGAVKYSILSQNRTTNISFDWDRMLSLDGNSAPYLQYAYARAQSILRRRDDTIEEAELREDLADTAGKILALKRQLIKFPEIVAWAAREYKPNYISQYLYDLAQCFNSFYNSVPVLRAASADARAQRLALVQATAQVLRNGLALLTIEVADEM